MMKRRLGAATMALVGACLLGLTGCSTLLKKDPSPCRNPEFVPALKAQGILFYTKGDMIGALQALKEAEACRPKDAELYYFLGLVYYGKDEPQKAIDNFQTSLKIDPGYTEARISVGVVYLALAKWDLAIAEFETALRDESFARPWEINNNLAWAYFQKGELELALVNAEKAIRLNNNFCPAYSNLGEIHAKKGASRDAITNYRKSIQICGAGYARPHFLLGIEFGKIGRIDMACQELHAATQVKDAPEGQQALEYMRLYNCPGVMMPPVENAAP